VRRRYLLRWLELIDSERRMEGAVPGHEDTIGLGFGLAADRRGVGWLQPEDSTIFRSPND
jgi:hypothetical protein